MSRRPLTFLGALVVVVVALLGGVRPSQDVHVVAFERVTVIPMDRERTLPAQTVIVQDGRIVELGPAADVKVPAGVTRIDGDARFLLPTLSEMHAHLSSDYVAPYAAGRFKTPEQAMERVLLMYVLNGIGTIRNMVGSSEHVELRDRAARGEIISPTVYTAGPPFSSGTAIAAQAAVEMVGAQQAAGYDFIKIFPGTVSIDLFNAMAVAAREAGVPIAGHVPSTIGLDGALAAGFQTIDHLDGYLQAAVEPGAPPPTFWAENLAPYVDTSRFAQLAARTKAAGTWMVPTQSLLEAQFSPETPAVLLERPEMVYVGPRLREQWIRTKTRTDAQYAPEHRASSWRFAGSSSRCCTTAALGSCWARTPRKTGACPASQFIVSLPRSLRPGSRRTRLSQQARATSQSLPAPLIPRARLRSGSVRTYCSSTPIHCMTSRTPLESLA